MADTSTLMLTEAPVLDGHIFQIGTTRLSVIAQKSLCVIAFAASDKGSVGKAIGPLPEPGQISIKSDETLIWTGQREVMQFFEGPNQREAALAARLGAVGHVTEVSDGWVALTLEGNDALRLLDMLTLPDLSEEAFPMGASTSTVLDHVRVLICRVATTRILILSPASSAKSLWHGLSEQLTHISGHSFARSQAE